MLWCAHCEQEYDLSFPAVCPDCGAELYEEAKDSWGLSKTFSGHPEWPVDADGESIPPVKLKTFGASQRLDCELASSMLAAYGIPVLQSQSALGKFGRLILGFSGTGTDLLVPETMLEAAKELLSSEQEANS